MNKYLFLFLFFIFSCSTSNKNNLTILAAISLKDVLTEISSNYNKNIVFSFAGSGTLRNQIELGSDADIFFSASESHVNILEENNLVEFRKDILENKIVLITQNSSNLKNIFSITNDIVKKIAIGEPKIVPAGEYAINALEKLNILDVVRNKIVYGLDVRNVLTWVYNNDVDCGIVYSTDAKLFDNIKILDILNTDKKILYPIVIPKTSKHKEEAKLFIDYLISDTSKNLFEKYGFTFIGNK